MINVGVREDNGVDGFWINREGRPVALAQRLIALEQTTIDQYTLTFIFKKMA